MKKSRYTEKQIAFALSQAEQGTPVVEVIRKMGITEQTFYRLQQAGHQRTLPPQAAGGREPAFEEAGCRSEL